MPFNNELDKYEGGQSEGDKVFWKLHKIQRYSVPTFDKKQEEGGVTKDHTRDADKYTNPVDNGPVELPSYLEPIKKIMMGIRESEESEKKLTHKLYVNGRHISSHDNIEDAKKAKASTIRQQNKDYKAGHKYARSEVEIISEAFGSEDEDKDGAADVAQEEQPAEDKNTGTSNGVGGSDVKSALEKFALQAAELYSTIDEKSAFGSEVATSIDSITEALGVINAEVTKASGQDDVDAQTDQDTDLNDEEEDEETGQRDNPENKQPTEENPDPDKDGDDDTTPEGDTDHDYFDKSGKKKKPNDKKKKPSFQKEEVTWINELSKKTLKNYVHKAIEVNGELAPHVDNPKLAKTYMKREKGLHMAVDRLAK